MSFILEVFMVAFTLKKLAVCWSTTKLRRIGAWRQVTSILNLCSKWSWVLWLTLHPLKDSPVPIREEDVWAPAPFWTWCKRNPNTSWKLTLAIKPDQLLYWLSYHRSPDTDLLEHLWLVCIFIHRNVLQHILFIFTNNLEFIMHCHAFVSYIVTLFQTFYCCLHPYVLNLHSS